MGNILHLEHYSLYNYLLHNVSLERTGMLRDLEAKLYDMSVGNR